MYVFDRNKLTGNPRLLKALTHIKFANLDSMKAGKSPREFFIMFLVAKVTQYCAISGSKKAGRLDTAALWIDVPKRESSNLSMEPE